MRRYRLSRPAKADLDRIWFRIAREASIETADRFVDTITARFPVLATMPEAGRARGDIEPGLYSFPVEDYIVYYRKGPRGRVLISRIIHGMRNQAKAWKQEDEDAD